jgi:superfamily I DNA and/or RNA helicase
MLADRYARAADLENRAAGAMLWPPPEVASERDIKSRLEGRGRARQHNWWDDAPGFRLTPVPAMPRVFVSTVDAAQGREFDVVIFSTVRAAAPPAHGDDDDAREGGGGRAAVRGARTQTIGFLRDTRRLNVALTRARYSLLVVGSAAALQVHPTWKAFVQHCKATGAAIDVADVAAFEARVQSAVVNFSRQSK